jgi:hypothetical protein
VLYKNYVLKFNSLSCILLAVQFKSELPYKSNINVYCIEILTVVQHIYVTLQ